MAASASPRIRQAVTIAALMMAWQVAAKTARDGLFLAVFDPRALPAVVGIAAITSVAMAWGGALLLRRSGPARVVPVGFFLSAAIHVTQWILLPVAPRAVSAFIYVYIVAFGPVLLTGFWALANETFDSREARQSFGKISAFGTAGAVVGGLLAERVGTLLSGPDILWLLAVLQVAGAVVLVRFAGDRTAAAVEPASFPEIISGAPYLAGLAVFVLLTSMSAAALDYLYKAGAVAQFGRGAALNRFFSLFNAGSAALTFLLQAGLSRLWMQRFGPGGTVASLPVSVAGASSLCALLPGPVAVSVTRALEQMVRGSLFRSGYELFYTPMPAAEKRAVKPVIDIGFDRMGEGLASAAIQLLLVLPGATFTRVLLLGTAAISAIAAWLAVRLDRSYVTVLERGLASQALQLEPDETHDALTRSVVMQSLTGTTHGSSAGFTKVDDPVLLRLTELRSSSATRVRAALLQPGPWEPLIVTQVIDLLRRDDVARVANDALLQNLMHATGQLADRLADPATDVVIRRRIPRLLAVSKNPLAWDVLFRQLSDTNAEIRHRCGRALFDIAERHPEFRPSEETVFLLFERELIAARTPHAFTHMANVLSLVLPPHSVQLAFRALQSGDPKLRATAIEYLDSVLPQSLREQLGAQFES